MAVRIGLPRGLLYYQYGSIWERFFQEIGVDVVVTGDTSKAILDCGSVLDEVCLPVKVYFGHVYELYKQVDYVFTPRVISVACGQYTCPKIIGIPDMLRSNIDHMPPIIDVNVNLRKNGHSLYQAITSVGRTLGVGAVTSLYAWYHAWNCRHQPHSLCHPGGTERQRIGLIGHPYIIYDRQISMNIIDKLHAFGADVTTPEMVDKRQAAAAAKMFGKKIFWSNSHHMAGAALTLMQSTPPVDGLIFMTSFSCGPDTLIAELIKQCAQSFNIPCMLLTVDEHTAEAGFITRLEAFNDMLIRRKSS